MRNVARSRQSSGSTAPGPSPIPAPRSAHRHRNKQPAAVSTEVLSASMRQAAMFADTALRRVLEVIDHRRPVAQLRLLLTPGLVDSVISAGRTVAAHPTGFASAAVLRRTRLQPAGQPNTAAEVFGTYGRGDRVHAIACRVERQPSPHGTRWRVVALHIG